MGDRLPRKLAAILYADVVGYSRLTGEDEEGTHHRLSEYLDAISTTVEAHRGRVMHYAGDAVLAMFDAVEDAVSSATDIQEKLGERNRELPDERKVQFRIGVNLGDVIEDRGDIYGDGVNVAARLESLAEPGGICISESIRTAVGNKFSVDFEDLGAQALKNIEDPVHAYRILNKAETSSKTQSSKADSLSFKIRQRAGRPSIAILPFKNLSGDPNQEHLVEGFAEDLITELSRFHSLSVVARTSAFAFRDETMSVQAISERLGGVDFVLEGSIRHTSERLRTTVRLVDCRSGIQAWTQRYDAEVEEIFETQDRIIADIVSHLELQIIEERLRTTGHVPAQTLKAYDLWLRGHQLMREWNPDADDKSVNLFERSIELDPDFARPYASLAGTYSSRAVLLPGNPKVAEDLALARQYGKTAVKLDPLDGRVHIHLGWAYLLDRDFESADGSFGQAGELNPNDADITISRALAVAYLGEPDKALGLAADAVERNPFHPDYYLWYAALIRFLASRYAETATMLEPLAEAAPPDIWGWYAAACSHMGRREDARLGGERFVAAMRHQWAGHQTAGPMDYTTWFIRITPLARAEDVERLAAGLHGAGLPETRDLEHWMKPASVV